MAVIYYKRFRMEMGLMNLLAQPPLPVGYSWLAWNDALIEAHARVKSRCFQDEIDSQVFPALGSYEGCLQLMREISRRPGFCQPATWLISGPNGLCGTIQGVVDRGPIGAIQNVGVEAEHRGLGLGKALVRRALDGFRSMQVDRAYLEVTSHNSPAVLMYKKIGFSKVKTLYKAVEDVSRRSRIPLELE